MKMRKLLIGSGISTAVITLGIFCIIWFWRPGTLLKEANYGHRLGGDLIQDFPENTLAVFEQAVTQHESNDKFHYSECDLRETKDHEIVIFHDWDLSRLVPDSVENRTAIGLSEDQSLKSVCIHELTIDQIKRLRLEGGHEIPTLEEVLKCACRLEIEKPLLLEIKLLQTDAGRGHVLSLAKSYRDSSDIEIHFLAFRRNISRSFPEPRNWLDKFAAENFRVYQAFRSKTEEFDLCRTW